jgi:hypothetical protein
METNTKPQSKIGIRWLNYIQSHKKAYQHMMNLLAGMILGLLGLLITSGIYLVITDSTLLLNIFIILATPIITFIVAIFYLETRAMSVARDEMCAKMCPKDQELYRAFLKEYP